VRHSRVARRRWFAWKDVSKKRLLAAVLFAMAGCWLVITVGAAAILRSGQPDLALRFAPWDARALGRAAERELASGTPDRAAFARAAVLARRALRWDPTIVPAWRMLGLNEAAKGRGTLATRLFAVSEKLSRRDLPTQLWLIEEAVGRGDVAGALHHYDVALRTNPKAHDRLMPILVTAAGDPNTAPALGRLLATRPFWSGNFYYRLATAPAETAPDPANVARVIALARRGGPPTNPEMLGQLIGTMIDRGAYRPALSLHAALSGRKPVSIKALFNGDFEALNAHPPMDWAVAGDVGLGAEVRSDVGGRGNSLVAYASGDQNGVAARQITVLPPGNYALQYVAGRTERSAPSRLQWQLVCAVTTASGALLLDQPIDLAPGKRPYSAAFRVPSECPAQWLSLEVGSTDPEGSEAWVDDAVIARRIEG